MPSNDVIGRITLNLSGTERVALATLLDGYCGTDLADPDRDVLLAILHKLGIEWHPADAPADPLPGEQ